MARWNDPTRARPLTTRPRATCDKPQLAGILLRHGAKVDAETRYGTPLLGAVHFTDVEGVRVLLKYGADADLAAADGMRPRALAIRQQLWEITKPLETA